MSIMDLGAACIDLGIALALGLLVGVQRERSRPTIAGVRTFGFIGLLGAIVVVFGRILFEHPLGVPMLTCAGLLAVVALAAIGNRIVPSHDESPGITTEAAMLSIYLAGALSGAGEHALAATIGVSTAVLLQVKPSLHRFTAALTDGDLRAILQFAVITFIVLPIVPDRAMGPFDAINPRQVWLMVVLVVGISLCGYVALRLAGGTRGVLVAGLIGGLVSSTAATASFARRIRAMPALAHLATVAILLAGAVVHIRVLVELAAVAPAHVGTLAPPVAALLLVNLGICAVAARGLKRSLDGIPQPQTDNPAELRGALVFGALLALVQLAAAAAMHWFGGSGLYAVAAISGLTDLDAITLSTGGFLREGRISRAAASASILIALLSNLAMKTGLAIAIAGWGATSRLRWCNAAYAAACLLVLTMWVPRLN